MLASYIKPPFATVKVAIPFWYPPAVAASFLPPLMPAEVPTHAELGQRRVADVFPLFVHAALAKSTAYPHTPLADRWKHRVAIGFAEETAAFTCIFEDADRIAVLVGPC